MGGEGDDRGWNGWTASLTRWTQVRVSFGSWWWTGRPGVTWSMGLQSWTQLSEWTELRSTALWKGWLIFPPHHNFGEGGKYCYFRFDTLLLSHWEGNNYMHCNALTWLIRTVAEKRSAWVPATEQTDYPYAAWVTRYKPICHTEEGFHVIWCIAGNGLGEIYLDSQQGARNNYLHPRADCILSLKSY